MSYALRLIFCLVYIVALAGCGAGVAEKGPPKTTPKMTDEERKNYDDQMKMMQKQHKKNR